MTNPDMIIAIITVPVMFLLGYAAGFAARGDDNGQ